MCVARQCWHEILVFGKRHGFLVTIYFDGVGVGGADF